MNVFLIENKGDLCKALKAKAMTEGIELDYSTNLEDGIKKITKHKDDIDLVILDGKGYLSPEDQKEKSVHASRGVNKISDINPKILIVIYSAYIDEIAEQLVDNVKYEIPIFDKNNTSIDQLLIECKELISSKEEYYINKEYQELFFLYQESYLDRDRTYAMLIDILTCLHFRNFDELNSTERQGLFTSIRIIQESLFERINEYYDHIFEEFENKTSQRISVLGGRIAEDENGKWIPHSKVYMLDHYVNLARLIQRNTSSFSHYSKGQSESLYSSHHFKALVFALVEILRWFKQGLETNIFDN